MPRDAAANQRIKDERRQHILDTARLVFARKGLSAAKISDIATAAGLSHGLVYHYFTSKEAVFTEIVRNQFESAYDLVAEANARPGRAIDKLRWFCAQMLDLVRERPEAFMMTVHAFIHDANPQEVLDEIVKFSERCHPKLVRLIEQGQAEGDIVAIDPHELLTTFFGTIHGLALRQLHDASSPCVFKHRVFPQLDTVLRLFTVRAEPPARGDLR